MSNDAPDPMLDRAIDELRRLPPPDPVAIRRIVNAAAEARLSSADGPLVVDRSAGRSIRIWSAVGLAAAAAIAGFVTRGAFTTKAPKQTAAATSLPATSSESLRSVVSSSAESRPILQQFVFENAHARRVSVVGDFNKWNPGASPMQRSSDDATWSVIIPIVPGRHIYGYMVDDSVFTLDPREPRVTDRDLGTEASVVIVGRP
jgi:hypothetical protein